MGNYKDYIKWRGDLTFEQAPLNEVDNVIFSMLAYVDYSKILAFMGCDSVTVSKAFKVATEIGYGHDKQDLYISEKSGLELLQIVCESTRFKDVVIRNHVDVLDLERMLQFSATEFCLDNNSSYIAFRGTDDTITGWKEDFVIAIREMPAAYEAAAYLNRKDFDERDLYIGGHSKGAHLAVYASAKAPENLKPHIKAIYSNDGPGFDHEFLESEALAYVKEKITSLVPKESVVGMLLPPAVPYQVIASDKHSFLQHNAINWRLEGPAFVRAKSLAKASDKLYRSITSWVDGMPMHERESFLKDLFLVLDAPGCKTISEVQASAIKSIPAISKALNNLAPETKTNVMVIVKYLLKIEL